MIKTLKSTLTSGFAALLLGVSMSASAALTGVWTPSNGAITADTSPTDGVSLLVSPPASGPHTYFSNSTGAGTYSFNWSANVSGPEGPTFFGTYVNSIALPSTLFSYTLFVIDDQNQQQIGPESASGSASITVDGDDQFGFLITTSSSQNGLAFASLIISEFSFEPESTNNVPEPTSLALIGLGLVGIATMRRRKSV